MRSHGSPAPAAERRGSVKDMVAHFKKQSSTDGTRAAQTPSPLSTTPFRRTLTPNLGGTDKTRSEPSPGRSGLMNAFSGPSAATEPSTCTLRRRVSAMLCWPWCKWDREKKWQAAQNWERISLLGTPGLRLTLRNSAGAMRMRRFQEWRGEGSPKGKCLAEAKYLNPIQIRSESKGVQK